MISRLWRDSGIQAAFLRWINIFHSSLLLNLFELIRNTPKGQTSISCRTVQSFSSTMLNGWASTLTYQPPRWIMIAKMIIILNHFYSKSPQAWKRWNGTSLKLCWPSYVYDFWADYLGGSLSVINFVFKVHKCTLCENVYFHAMVQDILHTRVRTSGIVEVKPCGHSPPVSAY